MSVYLRAARNIIEAPAYASGLATGDKRWCCCDALHMLDAPTIDFTDVFLPDGSDQYDQWWECVNRSTKDQQARILALLFMHWMTVNPC